MKSCDFCPFRGNELLLLLLIPWYGLLQEAQGQIKCKCFLLVVLFPSAWKGCWALPLLFQICNEPLPKHRSAVCRNYFFLLNPPDRHRSSTFWRSSLSTSALFQSGEHCVDEIAQRNCSGPALFTYTKILLLLVLAVKGVVSLKLPTHQVDWSSSSGIPAIFFWKTAQRTASINRYESLEHIHYFYWSINDVSVKDTGVLINRLQDIVEKLWLPNAWTNSYIRRRSSELLFQIGAFDSAKVPEDLSR